MLPAKVAGPLTMLKTIGSPLLAVAVRRKGASPVLLSAKGPKVMDWVELTAKLRSTGAAAA